MAAALALVTGATGLLGSHIAQKLVERDIVVRAIVRPGSDARYLETLGVEILRGDLTCAEDCRKAVQGVGSVYHAAAKVGDWGRWADFQSACLDATYCLAKESIRAGVGRFVHISSTSAYGHPKEGGPPVDETAPLGQNLWPVWDYYTRSKVEGERLLWSLVERGGLKLTVIRPSWLFGERDRTTTDRLATRLRRGGVPLIGSGDNPLSAIYAGEVARAAILASEDPASEGEAYNVTDQGPITQRDYLSLWAEACGAPSIRKRRRYWVVFPVAFGFEAFGRLTRSPKPPLITRYATWLMGRDLAYSTQKIRTRLGWSPELTYREAIARTVRWYDERDAALDRHRF